MNSVRKGGRKIQRIVLKTEFEEFETKIIEFTRFTFSKYLS